MLRPAAPGLNWVVPFRDASFVVNHTDDQERENGPLTSSLVNPEVSTRRKRIPGSWRFTIFESEEPEMKIFRIKSIWVIRNLQLLIVHSRVSGLQMPCANYPYYYMNVWMSCECSSLRSSLSTPLRTAKTVGMPVSSIVGICYYYGGKKLYSFEGVPGRKGTTYASKNVQ